MLAAHELEKLIDLLETRLRVIADVDLRERDPDGQLAQLQAVSEAIVAFRSEHRPSIPPRLNHFLENFSLQKALDWAKAELAKG